ncbi:hypothetical protein AT15_01005 [Kosmotoga arenicorallina S304]|uniref:Uncharacterized protein n=1 Tax=Kosmotoga arenicorallina S304 TaxID=1453497 RepID=A0A176K0Y3_9BACT|nr:hypothetical protein AT15_01005 [Kosmotoga arenicorallina S304]
MVGSCATGTCEPGQVRKEAAISGLTVCRRSAQPEFESVTGPVSVSRRWMHGAFFNFLSF